MKYIKQFSAAVLSFCMLLGIAPTTSAIYAASPISVYTQTDGLTTVRQISVADKNTLQSSTALFSAMGYTSAEANSISEADKTALLNSTGNGWKYFVPRHRRKWRDVPDSQRKTRLPARQNSMPRDLPYLGIKVHGRTWKIICVSSVTPPIFQVRQGAIKRLLL